MSAKETDNPIGQFGSGLKYAIAVLLRNEHEIEVYTPEATFIFGTRTKFFRGKEFQIVTCNDKELGITTDMGKHWELWMAYRELVCNTIDEGGLHFTGDKFDHGTSIVVKGEEFHALIARHEEFFVGEREPIATYNDKLNVYEGKGSVFYRGVRVGHLENANFSYEILRPIQLTEDRTYANIYEVNRYISQCITQITNVKFIDRFLLCDPKESYESKLDFGYRWSDQFERCCLVLWKMSPGKVFRSIVTKLREMRPELCIEVMEMTEDQKVFLETVLDNLSQSGFPIKGNIQLTSSDAATRVVFSMGNQICITETFFYEGIFSAMGLLFKVWLEENHAFSSTEFLCRSLLQMKCKQLKLPI